MQLISQITKITCYKKNTECKYELRGTMRFKPQDPLIEILQCMRLGRALPDSLWAQFEERVVRDEAPGVADARLDSENFRSGYCMSIYWTHP